MIELVSWRDAHFELEDSGEQEDFIVETVGWVEESGRWLRIESEQTPGGPRCITRVPVENVVSRKPLFPGPSAAQALERL